MADVSHRKKGAVAPPTEETQGSVPFADGSGNLDYLAGGTEGYVLTTHGAGMDPTWEEGGAGGADATAIHDDTAAEISAITAKATPTTSDYLLIEDAAASNAKKSVTIGALQGVLTITESQISDLTHVTPGGAGTDTTAIHDNVSGEIAAITAKATPVAGDFFIIEDSAAANVKKSITMADIIITESQISDLTHVTPGGAGTDTTAIHDDTSGEIAAVTAKATPTTSDYVLIEDAAASNAKKSMTIGALQSMLTLTESQISDLAHVTPNTLDGAYDQGGAGSGRTIAAEAGAVQVTASSGISTAAVDISHSGTGIGLDVNHAAPSGTAAGVDVALSGAAVGTPAIAVTESAVARTAALVSIARSSTATGPALQMAGMAVNTPVALSAVSNSIAINLALSNQFTLADTAYEDADDVAAFTNGVAGQQFQIIAEVEPGTTLTWNAVYKWDLTDGEPDWSLLSANSYAVICGTLVNSSLALMTCKFIEDDGG